MVLGLLLRDAEERALGFDFEMLLPNEGDDMDDGSGFGGGGGGKKDFKRGTVVCRHWLRALCMKGDNCEFLHQYDMSKMPECRWGMECQVPECPFRHVPDEERVECAFYKQGFCSHGSSCRYRHIKLAREECPETADFSLQAKVADEENVKRRKAQPVNEFFKIAICKHWEKMGSCPFNDECHFAHGEKELRPFPKDGKDSKDGHMHGGKGGDRGPRGGPDRGGFNSGNERAQQAPPPPAIVLPDENKLCKYFLLQSQSYHNVAHAVHFSRWSLPKELQQQLKMASETSDDVFLIVTVGPSKHFQGVARLAPAAMINAGAEDGEDLSAGIVPYQSEGKTQWSGAFGIEWLRICECPWERLQQFENKHLAVPECPNGQELDADMGHSLVRLLFNQAQIQLHYKSVEDEQQLAGGAEELATRRRKAAESVFGGGMGAQPAPRWKVSMPGFVFACNNTTIDEVFGRMVVGLAKDQEVVAAKHVVPGTPLFLLNMSDRHVLGIFEAVSPIVMNLAPGAFSHGPQVPSPFPVQARFAVMLNATPIPTADPIVKQITGERGVRIGPLTLAVTQGLADLFAERCGAVFPPPAQMAGMGMPPPHMGGLDPSFRPPHGGSQPGGSSVSSSSSGAPKDPNAPALLEKMLVGIENDNEFSVTRRLIGPSGSHMKRISTEASGGAKIRVRGRGSGSKESAPEEMSEPLMVLVSAENERSFRIACELTSELLASIHHEYRLFLAQKQKQQQQQHRPVAHFHGGGFAPHQFHGGGPPGGFGGPGAHGGGGGGGGGYPMGMRGGPPGAAGGDHFKQEPK